MVAFASKTNYTKGFRLPLPPESTRKPREYKEHSQFVYSLIYYRVEILLVILALVILFSGFFAAECKAKLSDFANNDPGGILGIIVKDGGWIDDIINANQFEEYKALLHVKMNGTSIEIGNVGGLGNLAGILSSINKLFISIAWGLALIFWGYSFMNMILESNGQLIVEQMVKKLVLLVVCFYVIKDSLIICGEIVNAGTELMGLAMGVDGGNIAEGTKQAALDFKNAIFDICWQEKKVMGIDVSAIYTLAVAVGYMVLLLIPWVISKVCGLVVRLLIWSRAIEICIFAAISPIMFIDLGTTRDLTHSSTARALKNLISLSMQGALILISLAICQTIMGGIMKGSKDIIDQIWQMCLVSLLQVGTISKTQSVAKQALGM